jgi:hypothetical protein
LPNGESGRLECGVDGAGNARGCYSKRGRDIFWNCQLVAVVLARNDEDVAVGKLAEVHERKRESVLGDNASGFPSGEISQNTHGPVIEC